MALHRTHFIARAQVECRILHSGGIENALLEQVGVGFAAGVRQRGAEKVKAVVRIERGRARRKQQGIGLEVRDLDLPGVGAERIVRRPIRTRHLARQAGGMGREVDQPDRMSILLGQRDLVAEPVLQSIGELQLAVEHHAGEHLAAKHLADGADAKHRIGIGRLVALVGDLAKTGEGHLAAAYRNEDEARDLGIEIGQCAREVDRFVESSAIALPQGAICAATTAATPAKATRVRNLRKIVAPFELHPAVQTWAEMRSTNDRSRRRFAQLCDP